MLAITKLPKMFWAEALLTACYLVNLSLCHHLEGGYPERAWTGQSSRYDHFKVFGYRAFVHIPADERSKLNSKTHECILVGYGLDDSGYKLYDLCKQKVYIATLYDLLFVQVV